MLPTELETQNRSARCGQQFFYCVYGTLERLLIIIIILLLYFQCLGLISMTHLPYSFLLFTTSLLASSSCTKLVMSFFLPFCLHTLFSYHEPTIKSFFGQPCSFISLPSTALLNLNSLWIQYSKIKY